MKYNSSIHHRRSVRLKSYDYSEPGDYFITICSYNRKCIFGEIIDQEMILNELGKIAQQYLLEIKNHFLNTEIEIYQIMPNHVHLVIMILCDDDMGIPNVGAEYIQPLQGKYQHIIPNSIPSIIRCYKSAITHWANKNSYKHFKWQRGYYEHIIRNQKSYDEIYTYIESNSQTWDRDKNNPKNFEKKMVKLNKKF